MAEPICRHSFDARGLAAKFPPKLSHPNKRIVHGIACPPGCVHRGEVVFTRWREMDLPTHAGRHPSSVECREGFFGYEPTPAGSPDVEWYLNFAHSHLFAFYGGPLFAQDEMQVAEHPALGSLREALLSAGIDPLSVENGEPTPALVRGVERRCRVATDPDAGQGRPSGLYGNAFARADAEAIRRATAPIDPPTVTNILAMEAPDGGSGTYSRKDIDSILSTAYTGFSAARIESGLVRDRPRVVIHTGFWGCGAYGGNRILMAMLQVLAARLAAVDALVFHTGDPAGTGAFEEARALLDRACPPGEPIEVAPLLETIHAMKFRWGVSDGN